MTVDTEILHRWLALPEKDRAELAHELLASLDSDADKDAPSASALAAEIERRTDQIDCGEAVMHDRQTSMQQAREALAKRRPMTSTLCQHFVEMSD